MRVSKPHRPICLAPIHSTFFLPPSHTCAIKCSCKHVAQVLDVITKYSDGKSTLVFCDSKKACESLAYKLAAAVSALASRQPMAAKDRFSCVANPKLRCVRACLLVWREGGTGRESCDMIC